MVPNAAIPNLFLIPLAAQGLVAQKNPLVSQYTLNGSQIKRVLSIKYLGMIINSKLTWSDNVTYISQKASNVRAFLQRNLKHFPPSVKIKCYESYHSRILLHCMGSVHNARQSET